MNTTLIKGAVNLVAKYCVYSSILDGIRYKERLNAKNELEKLRIEKAKLETKVEMQQMVIDILQNKPVEKKETTEEEQ